MHTITNQGKAFGALATLNRSDVEQPPAAVIPLLARSGRGATTNPAVRFDAQSSSPFDDGWDTLTSEF
ncbi:MAG: hypothetical protein JO227_01010, partial [Acetobacteraceae bacterium]|nr:hypothetical protein [Acetobacteraceae bacterium]